MRIYGVRTKYRRDRADQLTRGCQKAIEFRTPLALFLLSLSIIAAVWCWLATPVALTFAPIASATKVDCVSYAPFRDHQSPWNSGIIVSAEQIASDLTQLAKITGCIRTYSVENGLDKVPELASKVGLKVLLGVLDRTRSPEEYPADQDSVISGQGISQRGYCDDRRQ